MPAVITPEVLIIATLVALFAGLVKGVTGFAMPMIMISGLGSFLPPEIALAGLILPTLATNLWQAFRQGIKAALASARAHWRYLTLALVFIAIAAQFATSLPETFFFLVLGIPVAAFALLQLVGWRPRIDPARRGAAEIGTGIFAGIIGGLSGVWGPPTVLYLTAMETPKTEHVRIQGVVYGAGAVVLTLSHLQSGILDGPGATFSAILLVPALIGMVIGFAVQDRIGQETFRWAILIVLACAGLNLIRRGLFG